MANLISLNVLQMPDGSDFSSAADPCPVHALNPLSFQDVAPASAGQIAQFPPVNSQITVAYKEANNTLTGAYLVSQTVQQIVDAANEALSS